MPNNSSQKPTAPAFVDPKTIFPVLNNTAIPPIPEAQKPYPTNAYWANLAQGNTDTVAAYPYITKLNADSMELSYPTIVQRTDYNSSSVSLVAANTQPDFTLTAKEFRDQPLPAQKPVISHTSPLTFTCEWKNKQQSMKSHVVNGSPYSTIFYEKLTPQMISSATVKSVNSQTKTPGAAEDKQFVITFTNGQVWVAYFSQTVILKWEEEKGKGSPVVVFSTRGSFDTSVRLALVEDPQRGIKNDIAILNQFKDSIITDSSIKQTINTDGSISTIFDFAVLGDQPPLLLALPHHQKLLPKTSIVPFNMTGFHGEMKGVASKQWLMTLPPAAAKVPPLVSDIKNLPKDLRDDLVSAIAFEEDIQLPEPPQDIEIASYSDALKKAIGIAKGWYLLDKPFTGEFILQGVRRNIISFMRGEFANSLGYDGNRLITKNSASSVLADGGVSRYDRHYANYAGLLEVVVTLTHYLGTDWLLAPLKGSVTIKDYCDALVRDICNLSGDPYFNDSGFNHYLGVNQDSGLEQLPHGNYQEQAAASADALRLVYWYGKFTANQAMMDTAQIRLAQEIQADQCYRQAGNTCQNVLPAATLKDLKSFNQPFMSHWAETEAASITGQDVAQIAQDVQKYRLANEAAASPELLKTLLPKPWASDQLYPACLKTLSAMNQTDPVILPILKLAALSANTTAQYKNIINIATALPQETFNNTGNSLTGLLTELIVFFVVDPHVSPKPSPKPPEPAKTPKPQPSKHSSAAQHPGFLANTVKMVSETVQNWFSYMGEFYQPGNQPTPEEVYKKAEQQRSAVMSLAPVSEAITTAVAGVLLTQEIAKSLNGEIEKHSEAYKAQADDREELYNTMKEHAKNSRLLTLYLKAFPTFEDSPLDFPSKQTFQDSLNRLTLEEQQEISYFNLLKAKEIKEKHLPHKMLYAARIAKEVLSLATEAKVTLSKKGKSLEYTAVPYQGSMTSTYGITLFQEAIAAPVAQKLLPEAAKPALK